MSYNNYVQWRETPITLTPELSVIIPTFNESDRIVPTIASIVAHLTAAGREFEIIVSDDGSTDDTVDLVRRIGLRNLVVLDPGINRGKGAAVRAGVAAAGGDLILFTDADLSTPISQLDALLQAADGDWDVVIGSRGAAGADETQKSHARRLLSWGARAVTRFGLGLDEADTQCGFKLFRRDAARTLFAAQVVNGFAFDAELLFLARRMGYRVVEVPIRWVDAPGSTVKPVRTAVAFTWTIVAIRTNALRGRYPSGGLAGDADRLDPGLRLAVVTALPPSSATLTEYGHHLVENLSRKTEVAELLVFADDRDGVPPSTAHYRVESAWRFDSLSTPWRLWLAVRRERPDAVLFNAHFTSFGTRKIVAAAGLAMPAVLRLTGTPTIVLLHNIVDTVDLESAGYGGGRLVNRLLVSIGRLLTHLVLRANWVATTMPTYVDVLEGRYGALNVSLTPHGSFETPAMTGSDPSDGRRRLLAFGKFGTYKRVDVLIDAYRLLSNDPAYDDVELVIAGTDSPNAPGYLERVAANSSDLSGLRFTGYVEEDDVPALFDAASIVVFPYSATTGSSGPLHQAGAHARAVVAPRIGDFLDLIDHEGYCASSFEPDDAASLANALAVLFEDDAARRDMGRRNHAAAVSIPLADVCDWHIDRARALAG